MYKESEIRELMSKTPILAKSAFLDLGQYPMTPWVDAEPEFISKHDELKRGSAFLDKTYEL